MSRAAATLLLILACAAWPAAQAGPPQDARTLLLTREARERPKSEEYLGEIIVTSANGRERKKLWRSYRSGPPGNADRLIRFLSPADVRGVGYLGHFRTGKTPDEWLYLPSMKRERRIGPHDREEAFAGTTFAFEDLDLLEFDDTRYDASFVSTAPNAPAPEPVFVIELRPRTASAYSRKVLVLARADLRLLSVDYFTQASASPVKRLRLSEYSRVAGYQVASRVEMADLATGDRTVVELHDIALDRPQPRDRYTIANLLREDEPRDRGGAGPLAFAFGPAAVAGETRAGSAVAVPGSVSGSAEVRSSGYFGRDATRHSTSWATVNVRESFAIGSARVTAALRMEASDSPQVGSVTFDPADRGSQRSPLSVHELSLLLPVRPGIDLRLGRFDVAWGDTDGYSPADAFLPRDLSDPLSQERLPLWGVQLRGVLHGLKFDALWVPVTTPWRLPDISGSSSPFARVGVTLEERVSPTPIAGFGALLVSGTARGWDLGAWARAGVRPAAVIDPHFDDSVTVPSPVPIVVPVDRRFASETAGGGSMTHPLGSWLVRGELGIFHSQDAVVGTAAIWSIGASQVFHNGVFTATFAMNLVEPPGNPLLLFDRALLPCVILVVHRNTAWGGWNVGWLTTMRTVGGVLSGEIARDLSDHARLTVGADLPHGATLSPATAFSGGERVRVAVKWSW